MLACFKISAVEPHHFNVTLAPEERFDAAPAPTSTLLYRKAKIF
jgi:hypothetical protein